jgi:hypothetical protein
MVEDDDGVLSPVPNGDGFLRWCPDWDTSSEMGQRPDKAAKEIDKAR